MTGKHTADKNESLHESDFPMLARVRKVLNFTFRLTALLGCLLVAVVSSVALFMSWEIWWTLPALMGYVATYLVAEEQHRHFEEHLY